MVHPSCAPTQQQLLSRPKTSPTCHAAGSKPTPILLFFKVRNSLLNLAWFRFLAALLLLFAACIFGKSTWPDFPHERLGFRQPAAASEELEIAVGPPLTEVDTRGFIVHSLISPYQAGTTAVRVLLPDGFNADKRYRLLYVLPVEPGVSNIWGDGLVEVRKSDLHNRHQVICIEPTFSHLPWYCDHASDKAIRQESHMLKAVLPHIERLYQKTVASGDRLLVGFSKSGWGAFSLLLRNPDVFGRAVAWDAPLMMTHPSHGLGMDLIFGTQENFENYRLTNLFAQSQAYLGNGNSSSSQRKQRLGIHGIGSFLKQQAAAHQLLKKLNIPHEYTDGPKRIHRWDSGWIKDAVDWLAESPPLRNG